jgi:hypothetical protein
VLLRAKHTVQRLVGTSAGAVTAMALAAGYTPEEMLAVLVPKAGQSSFAGFLQTPTAEDFPPDRRDGSELVKALNLVVDGALNAKKVKSPLKDKPLLAAALRLLLNELNQPLLLDALMAVPRFAQFYSLLEVGAVCSDRRLVAWLKEQLKNKGFAEEVTLKEFHEANRRDLSVVAVDTVGRELLVLNHRTAPNCPVWAAVRMSMGLPFVWPEVAWPESWGTYRGREMSKARIMDGGMLSNFPMRLLVDGHKEDIRQMMGEPDPPEVRRLGLYLDDRKPVPGAEDRTTLSDLKLAERAARIIDTTTAPWDQEIVDRYAEDICFIASKGFNLLDFDLDERRVQALVNSGRCAMTAYLQQRRLAVE